MMRKMVPGGVCACCGREGAVCRSFAGRPLFADEPGMIPKEVDMLPDLCDGCNYAQKRWDAWQWCQANPGAAVGYPYADPPPKSPPVRRGEN